jgi:hypothetical protein
VSAFVISLPASLSIRMPALRSISPNVAMSPWPALPVAASRETASPVAEVFEDGVYVHCDTARRAK